MSGRSVRLTSDITEEDCDSGTSTRVAVVGNITSDLSLGVLLVNWTVSELSTYEGLPNLTGRCYLQPGLVSQPCQHNSECASEFSFNGDGEEKCLLCLASILCAFLKLIEEKVLVCSFVVHLEPQGHLLDFLDPFQVRLVCLFSDHV